MFIPCMCLLDAIFLMNAENTKIYNVDICIFWSVSNYDLIYTPCPEKTSHSISRHNFDKFRRSFVIFGMNHPEDSFY